MPFFIGLKSLYDDDKWNKALIIIGQAAGIFTAIALIGVGIFSETHITEHIIAAGLLFKSLFILMILFNIALFQHSVYMRALAYYGLFVIFIDLAFIWVLFRFKDILGQFTPTMPIPGLEWSAVFASLAWIGALSWIMVKKRL